jgi:[acyl-carrier-protein] S-malonyltransferase
VGSVAFLFPGQGSQQPGMGTELLEDDEISALCDDCERSSGVKLRHLLTDADDDELRLTYNAQPALLFAGVALARLLARRGVEPQAAAGHSLGEYTALCVGAAIAIPAAVGLVHERGRAMAEAAPPGTTSMAAVLGLSPEAVEQALKGTPDVWPANYNTPTQTVVAGTVDALEQATRRLQDAGARRVIPLNVSTAFHTPLLAPAGRRLRAVLDRIEWARPAFPVMANLSGQPYNDPLEIPEVLEQQLRSPVRWSQCVDTLAKLGCEVFVEVGPKRALSGMMRELAQGAATLSVSTPAAAAEVAIPA